ncbi:PEP-CTERM sorting domain-containing protein [Candidatus Omnitrophota bacterium]
MKKLLLISFALALVLAVSGRAAFAYSIDGDLSDWGVSLFSDWIADSPTADQVVDDDHTIFGDYWTPITGKTYEQHDVEALYFDDSPTDVYISMVSSRYFNHAALSKSGDGTWYFDSGDIAIGFNGANPYKYGVRTSGLRPVLTSTSLQKNPEWVLPQNKWLKPPYVPVGDDPVGEAGVAFMAQNGPSATPLVNLTGIYQGDVELCYREYQYEEAIAKGISPLPPDDATTEGLMWRTWVLEMKIDRFLFEESLMCGQGVFLNYSLSCANDYLKLEGDLDYNTTPEPSTFLLFGMAIAGLGAHKLKISLNRKS